MHIRLFGFLLLFFSPGAAIASDIMFEGYYRIELEGKPIGYIIERFAFDPKAKIFEAISFQYINAGDKVIQESIKETANDKLHPLAFQYTSQVGEKIKMIDGSFKADIMTLKINDGKTLKTEVYKNPKGTFLSTLLPYKLLQEKLQVNNTALSYSAVAEEDGGSYNGKVLLKKKEAKAGFDLFSLQNKFKGEEFSATFAAVRDAQTPGKYIRAEIF